ncbi:type VI secretion system membrane subunit TssM [Trinickia terrae]|uniref:Type VI secretion system membrane subunit TssM n=1 Tax=Trinickia terrae TaxID=2571161 RepID=A0A4U1I7H6_9BURK|nr:type VI secretion system membrane subunit TssM [Trinickia terrae]TKC89364.1 type VI secretion system membrane subunit TssM [Trinickia terrae]
MSYVNRFFRFIFSRQTLMFVAIILTAAAVWFIGPLLAFGEYYPMESVSSRVIVIVVLLALLLLWLLRLPLSPVWVAVAALAFWYLSPLLAFGESRPFGPIWTRVLLIAVLVGCYAAYGLYRLWQAMRSNDVILQRILNPFASKAKPEVVARSEIRAVNSVVTKAVDKLKRMHNGTTMLRRLLQSQRYLYELPWYMVIGSSGAGKTTMILNSGLNFPEADQMSAASVKTRVETANCDWWFTNEAVLIDTAGRYTVQDVETADIKKDDEFAKVNAAEWQGFLASLRKHRPRAPINGALLTVSVEEVLRKSPSERTALAAAMRGRLGELRQQFGIRFPVYVLVTKLDLLPGFPEYFQSLTAEGRVQILGFTLPYQDDRDQNDRRDLRQNCAGEMKLLEQRLEDGINVRLQEEYEADRRKKLYALPGEFRGLASPLVELIGLVFLDSKYDDTRLKNTLRGVYFTSAAQTHGVVPADKTTLLQRLRRGLAGLTGDAAASADTASSNAPTGYRGYFLRNLFQRVILAEGHLVRPNLRWEFRFRTLRIVGHLLSIAIAVWLIGSLMVSFDNNREYLSAISKKTDALDSQVKTFRKTPQTGAMAAVLSASHDLPQFQHVSLDSPGGDYRYGLYTAPGIVDASTTTYNNLLNQMLLPQIVSRLEAVLGAQLNTGDADSVYRTLSIYLMVFDKAHYDAKAIKSWVLQDWEKSDSAASMGDRNVMASQLDTLFVDGEPVTPRVSQNADLVQQARDFLGRNPVSGRLYERATAEMAKDAPENVTLVRAAGPQAGAVFALANGSSLESGVPGLYTYEGYHEVFNKRLPEFLAQAQSQDAWVMGRTDLAAKVGGAVQGGVFRTSKEQLANEIRRQYLTDYGNYWQQFLADIRPVASGSDSTLALDLQTLRTLAAPDSPLARLARTAVHETSLSTVEADDPTLGDVAMKAATRRSQLARAASSVNAATATIGQLAQQKMEKELVDNRFAALREVVTGQADTGRGPALNKAGSASGGAMQLDAIIGLINEQYARLMVAGNALSTNSMPPTADVGTTLQMEAEKLPVPFRAVLSGIATQSMQKVDQGVGSLLAVQVDSSVGDQCRRAIEGKYPFANSTQEVDIDDFDRVFAAGGLLDDFFQKTLSSHVDTSIRPWRYKSVSPGMPPINGPSLEPFERAAAIRQAFFRDAGGNRMAWKMGLKVVSLDPEITELALDIDGQGMRYVHGPVTVFPVTWPGPRGGAMAGITASPRVRPDTSTLMAEGPWALFRLMDRGRVTGTASSSRVAVDFNFDDRHAVLELVSSGQANPLSSSLFRGFRCPGSVAGG